jgi:hypothetical protein
MVVSAQWGVNLRLAYRAATYVRYDSKDDFCPPSVAPALPLCFAHGTCFK